MILNNPVKGLAHAHATLLRKIIAGKLCGLVWRPAGSYILSCHSRHVGMLQKQPVR